MSLTRNCREQGILYGTSLHEIKVVQESQSLNAKSLRFHISLILEALLTVMLNSREMIHTSPIANMKNMPLMMAYVGQPAGLKLRCRC